MTIGNAKDKLRSLLDEPSAGYYTDAQLYEYLDMAQMMILDKLIADVVQTRRTTGDYAYRKLALESIVTTDPLNTVTVGSAYQEYNLPSDFIYTDYAEYSSTGTTTRYPAILLPFGRITIRENNTYYSASPTTPIYYIKNNKIGFFPQPTGAGANAYLHFYYKRPIVCSAGNSGTEMSMSSIIHEAVVLMALSLSLKQDNRYQESTEPYSIAIKIISEAP